MIGRSEEDVVRGIVRPKTEGRQSRGRPKLTWEQMVGTDMAAGGIDGTLVEDSVLDGYISLIRPCHQLNKGLS